jgi:beta-lactamase superfamily II metal-dependent hydrolase
VPAVNTENERSLCFLLSYRRFHYLIGGDTIGREYGSENARVEDAIGEYLTANAINVDVLHVNHHGGNNASAEEFLQAIQPEVAIISLGNGNPHHHPNRDVLQRLVDAGVQRIYQTEWGTTEGEVPGVVRTRQAILQGDVVLTTNGNNYDVTMKQRFEVDE